MARALAMSVGAQDSVFDIPQWNEMAPCLLTLLDVRRGLEQLVLVEETDIFHPLLLDRCKDALVGTNAVMLNPVHCHTRHRLRYYRVLACELLSCTSSVTDELSSDHICHVRIKDT